MADNQLLAMVNYIERENGVERELVLTAIEQAIQQAARRNPGAGYSSQRGKRACARRGKDQRYAFSHGTDHRQSCTSQSAKDRYPL